MSIQNSISLRSSVTKETIVVMVRNRAAMEVVMEATILEDQTIMKTVAVTRRTLKDITTAPEVADSVIAKTIPHQMGDLQNEAVDIATVVVLHVFNKLNL